VIAARRLQRNFADGFIAEAEEDLWEPWMRHADKALEDDALLLLIQQALAKRCKKSKTRGRKATPAEVVLRMLLLKHVRDWSYETLSREVRANLVYREFTRVGGEKVPDDRTMGNLARQLGPEVIEQLNRRIVEGWRSPRNTKSPRDVGCASIRPWWRPTFIIRPTARCWVMACAF